MPKKTEVSNNIKACDKCGADIFFAKNSNGKWLPMNAELTEITKEGAWYLDGYNQWVKSSGKGTEKGYVSHFDSCGK